MKGIWPSERVNSQVDWLRADPAGTSAFTFTDKYFRQSQESKQTPDSNSFSHCVRSHLLGLLLLLRAPSCVFCQLAILSHAVSALLPSTLFFFHGFHSASDVSLFQLASGAHNGSSDTSLSWKGWGSRGNLRFSRLTSYETI